MTAKQVLYAYRRIAARRSQPKFHVSDNAQQFSLVYSTILKQQDADIKWKTTTDYAPWEGGAYEQLIRLSKQALRRTFHGKSLSDTTLCTALAEIAATLNSRPLTYVSEDSEDRPLTTNNFLKTTYRVNSWSNPTVPQTVTAAHLRYVWKESSELADAFWSQWKMAYLQSLREHYCRNTLGPRHTSPCEPTLNTVVLYSIPHQKRAVWPMGRIIGLNESKDGQIRSANLKLSNSNIITRPVSQLYPLEIQNLERGNTNIYSPAPTTAEEDSSNFETIEVELDLDN